MAHAVYSAIVAAVVFGAWRLGHATAQLADFDITVQVSADGAVLTCAKGCAWTTLNFECPGKPSCKAAIDQMGMRGADER